MRLREIKSEIVLWCGGYTGNGVIVPYKEGGVVFFCTNTTIVYLNKCIKFASISGRIMLLLVCSFDLLREFWHYK